MTEYRSRQARPGQVVGERKKIPQKQVISKKTFHSNFTEWTEIYPNYPKLHVICSTNFQLVLMEFMHHANVLVGDLIFRWHSVELFRLAILACNGERGLSRYANARVIVALFVHYHVSC